MIERTLASEAGKAEWYSPPANLVIDRTTSSKLRLLPAAARGSTSKLDSHGNVGMRTSAGIVMLLAAASAFALDCDSVPFVPSQPFAGLAVHVKVVKVYPKQGMDVTLLSTLSKISVPRKFHIDYVAVAYWDGDLFPEDSEWLIHLNRPTKELNKYSVGLCTPHRTVSNGTARGWIAGSERNDEQQYKVEEIRAMMLKIERKE